MGIVDWFKQRLGKEEPEEEDNFVPVEEPVSTVLSLDQRGVSLVNNALESLASIKRAVEGGMDYNDAKLQLAARGKIASMRTALRGMLDSKSASKDRSEMKSIVKEFSILHGEFSTLMYYHETFASHFADLRNNLRDLDRLLYPKDLTNEGK